MLRQVQQLKSYKKAKNFEDTPLFMDEDELLPIGHALGWALVMHLVLMLFVPFIVQITGLNLAFFNKPQIKQRDIEFVLVNQPEKDPINKNTPLRADRNSQAGGIHDPNKPISPPEQALPKSAPSQAGNDKKQKVTEEPAPAPKKVAQTSPQPTMKQEPKKVEQKQIKPAPKPPKPTAQASLPPSKSPNTMRLPVPPSNGAPKISTMSTGPVTKNPSGSYQGGTSSKNPKPVIASGGSGRGSGTKAPSGSGSGRGSTYSPGGGNAGNPGPGNPNGAPGVDAIREPNFGPYMSDLQRRIKANWDPPRGDESKRVVLLFKIAKDGRLLSVKVVKSSGSQAADRAALAAVELTAPFRALPSDYRGSDVDIQFTFDYNVFGVNRY